MSVVWKIFLSMSFSGALLILALFLGKRFLRDKISRQWQYYIWLVVILRLLVPFGPESSLLGKTYQAVDQAITGAKPLSGQQDLPDVSGDAATPADGQKQEETAGLSQGDGETAAKEQGGEYLPADGQKQEETAGLSREDGKRNSLTEHTWFIWLAAALGLLLRKVMLYRSFIRYVRAGSTPVSDNGILDRLSAVQRLAGVKKPVELCVNPGISSPMLHGFFHPCIVLPDADVSGKDFQYIVLHELIHYRRRDMFYKWLVQVAVCLHWFNPFVYLMSREIEKACEFSCDEAVLAKMGEESAQDYGKTLLDAMAAVGKCRKNSGAVTLSESKELLRERLKAIMNFKKKKTAVRILTGVLTLCTVCAAFFVGVYRASANEPDGADELNLAKEEKGAPQSADLPEMETLEFRGTTWYLVQNEAELRAISTGVYGMDRNYMQQADIQLSAEEWAPIGTWDIPFAGTYNGNGFEIVGLTMKDPDAEIAGLFGVVEKGHIYNVTLRDCDIEDAGRNASKITVGAIAAFAGPGSRVYDNFVYSGDAGRHSEAEGGDSSQAAAAADSGEYALLIEQYYENGSLPLFQVAFSRLDEETKSEWMDRIYADENIAFMAAVAGLLDSDCAVIRQLAERSYRDDNISCFSILTGHMSKDTLEIWLDKALEDGNLAFQSVLFDALGRDKEFDELEEEREKEWEEAQRLVYQAVGITWEGKRCYYQGQLVDIFLDIRADSSFYTLDMNPEGTVNIRIVRDADNKITGVVYMTEEEVRELLGDMSDADDEEG